MRIAVLAVAVVLAVFLPEWCGSQTKQTPDDAGSLSSTTYTNAALGLSYTFPSDLVPDEGVRRDFVAAKGRPPQAGQPYAELNDYPLLFLSNRNRGFSVVLWSTELTDRTNVRSPSEYLTFITGRVPEELRINVSPEQVTIAGKEFAHISFAPKTGVSPLWQAYFATTVHGFGFYLAVLAHDKQSFEEGVRSAETLRFAGTPTPSLDVPTPRRVRISDQLARTMLIQSVQPDFPGGVHDSVVLQVTIGTDGRVIDAQSISGPDKLSKAAIAAVRQWRYRPFLMSGTPVEAQTRVSFTLPSQPK